MGVKLPITIELDDVQLETLRLALGGTSKPGPMLTRPSADELQIPERWELVETEHEVPYSWGETSDLYDPFEVYEGVAGAKTWRLAIGTCERAKVRGRDRKYKIALLVGPRGGKRAVAEFLETDDYEKTGQLIAVIRGNGDGQSMYAPNEELSAFYRPYATEIYRERVGGPGSFNMQGLVVDESDYTTMLNHSLFQVLLRGLDRE